MWGRRLHKCRDGEEKGRRRQKERKRKRQRRAFFRTRCFLIAGILLFLASAAATGAYLTDGSEILLNRIAAGNVAVELTEPDWDPEEELHMLPQTSALKNPTAINTGTLESWIFMEVKIPVEKIALVNLETGRKQEETETELVSFTASEDWELIIREEEASDVRYLYGYKKTVKPLEKTTPLFSEITMVNYLEGELDADEVFQIPAETKSIQSSVCEEGTSLREIYQIYENSRK